MAKNTLGFRNSNAWLTFRIEIITDNNYIEIHLNYSSCNSLLDNCLSVEEKYELY